MNFISNIVTILCKIGRFQNFSCVGSMWQSNQTPKQNYSSSKHISTQQVNSLFSPVLYISLGGCSAWSCCAYVMGLRCFRGVLWLCMLIVRLRPGDLILAGWRCTVPLGVWLPFISARRSWYVLTVRGAVLAAALALPGIRLVPGDDGIKSGSDQYKKI